MKIVRFLTDNGRILHGRYREDEPDRADVIEGDILRNFKVTRIKEKILQFLPPIDPSNILALGLNYRKHADETKMEAPEFPVLFIKATSSVIGHEAPIQIPAAGPDQVDYEGELAVIISRSAKNITPDQAFNYVLGYTCANDVSARDWQFEKQKGQWARGKSFDTFCPLGPFLVTKDEIQDPNRLHIRTTLNDIILQDANTDAMIFHVADIVSLLSQSMTLLPSTVILTGTPEGVGFTRQPPVFMKEADIITIEIEKIGRLSNPVRKERPSGQCP
jgi:2-keto-4-pentenoate hydratase/2-oxohepta-3-ene-1,7-dioic acid hydratase in catechol pathway